MHELHEYLRYSGLFQYTVKLETLTNKSEFVIVKVHLVNLPECQTISMKIYEDIKRFAKVYLLMLFSVRIRQSF